jgi:hypothetical protein
MTKFFSALLIVVFLVSCLTAQIGINTTSPDPSAALDVTATDKGLLIPRVALASAIPSPAEGLMVYQTTAPKGFYYFNGTVWTNLSGGTDSELEKITEGGNTGHRILGRDPDNYGDIGSNAIDLSFSNLVTITGGATGINSTAMGYNTTASGNYSTVLGLQTTASGYISTAMGNNTISSGASSTAMGNNTISSGSSSTAMGDNTLASGGVSTAMGSLTIASGDVSTAMGYNTTASGNYSTSMGLNTSASGSSSTAMGDNTSASGDYSTATGLNTSASGYATAAMGVNTSASGDYSTAMGVFTNSKSYAEVTVGLNNTDYTPNSTLGHNSADRAFGVGIGSSISNRRDGLIVYKDGTLAFDKLVTAPVNPTDRFYILNDKVHYNSVEVGASEFEKITEGGNTGHRILGRDPANYGDIGSNAIDLSNSLSSSSTMGATGESSIAMGNFTTASGFASTAMGSTTIASGSNASAMGYNTTASGYSSIAEGAFTTASGYSSTAMGTNTTASGYSSTAMGANTTASGYSSTAIGLNTIAIGDYSIAMGSYTTAFGESSIAMGNNATSTGKNSTSMGGMTIASGESSTAMGMETTASGDFSTSMGNSTNAKSFAETTLGSFNTNYTPANTTFFNSVDRAFGVGIGADAMNRKDGLIVYKDGTLAFDKLTAAPATPTDRFYILNDKVHYNNVELNTSQLQKITEAGNTGFRVLGRDPANYGNIGIDAIDLSFSNLASSTRGATGLSSIAMGMLTTASANSSTAMGSKTTASANFSTAMGSETTASGYASTAMGSGTIASGLISTAMGQNTYAKSYAETVLGSFNTDYTPNSTLNHDSADRAFGVGIGADDVNRKDGLIVYKDGTLAFDKLIAAPTTPTDRFYILNDKVHYNNVELNTSQLQKITEAGNNGFRILGRDAANYGNIGIDAIDLSNSTSLSGTRGATGENSTSMGSNTTSFGSNSTAMGNSTFATGENSTSMGSNTTAFGESSTSMGDGTQATGLGSTSMGISTLAKSYAETVLGSFNTDYTPNSTLNHDSADRAFGVGIGTGLTNRKDGLIVFKDGTLAFEKLIAAPATPTDRFYILNDKVHYNNVELNTSQLQKITEAGNSGFRILGRDPANFGDIGLEAIDLSFSDAESTTAGATGEYSTALGVGTIASGFGSTAMGNASIASGGSSTAMGLVTSATGLRSTSMGVFTTASGRSSTAMGDASIASGRSSTAMGFSTTASGQNSIAMGDKTIASGFGSAAMGLETIAEGDYSTAIGANTTALGLKSAAFGDSTIASGEISLTIGKNTTAKSYAELVVGLNNTDYSPIGVNVFDHLDRAFGVGIGADVMNREDGLIVYKSGNTFISNDGNTPDGGTTSIFTGTTNTSALQVRSSINGVNILTPNTSTGINIAKATTPDNTDPFISFGHLNSGTYVSIGSITASSGTAVAYNTTSDLRLKIDNGTYNKGLSTLNQIKIHDYTWKETQGKDIGVFAQELYKVFPAAVSKGDEKAEIDLNKIKKRWQVDYSKLVPVLIAAMQELSAKNQELEKELSTYKAKAKKVEAQLQEMASLKSDIEAIKAQLSIGIQTVSAQK